MLKRYWFEFLSLAGTEIPTGLKEGLGVTAHDFEDALDMVQEKIFQGGPMPIVDRIVEDVDVSFLENEVVLANMWAPIWRGIWFPMGFQDNMDPDFSV